MRRGDELEVEVGGGVKLWLLKGGLGRTRWVWQIVVPYPADDLYQRLGASGKPAVQVDVGTARTKRRAFRDAARAQVRLQGVDS